MDNALRLSPHDPYHWIFLTIRAGAGDVPGSVEKLK